MSDRDAVSNANHAATSDSWAFGGHPTDAEIAAVVAVLTAARSSVSEDMPAPIDLWGRPEDLHRYGLASAPTLFVNARYGQ
ncbi:hypothetical protein HQO83_08375 [Rhodococcus fascians]|nr:hypothetical protein [Rhodococcus fascians]